MRRDICHSEGGLQGEGRMSGLGGEGGQLTMMSMDELVGPAASTVSTDGRLYGSLDTGRR